MLKEAGGRGFPESFPFPVAMGDPRFLDTEGWRGTVSECPTDGERRTANGRFVLRTTRRARREYHDEHDAPRAHRVAGTGDRT